MELKTYDTTFGAADHRTRNVESGCRVGPAGNHERLGQGHPFFQVGDLALQPSREIRRHDHEVFDQRLVLSGIGRQLGAHGEELALHSQDDGMPTGIRDQGAGRAQDGDGFIHSPVRFRARIGLGDSAAVQ